MSSHTKAAWAATRSTRSACAIVLTLLAALLSIPTQATPASAAAGGGSFDSVAAGSRHTCGLAQGAAYCWGDNDEGELGTPIGGRSNIPFAVQTDLRFASLVLGHQHTCGLTAGGRAHCWGSDDHGQLGNGTTSTADLHVPTAVAHTGIFTQLDAGHHHTCGVSVGQVLCWGQGDSGELGDGSNTTRAAPVAVPLPLPAISVTAGGGHSCAVLVGGTAWCWGSNGSGELGDGTSGGSSSVPVPVAGGHLFTAVAAGGDHTCGNSAGTVRCWGFNTYNQLGLTQPGNLSQPGAPVPGTYLALAVEHHRSCALAAGGAAWCWGLEVDGEKGDGGAAFDYAPGVRQVTDVGAPFTMLSVGREHSCGVTLIGETWCWGDNSYGQLGLANTISQVVPHLTDTSNVERDPVLLEEDANDPTPTLTLHPAPEPPVELPVETPVDPPVGYTPTPGPRVRLAQLIADVESLVQNGSHRRLGHALDALVDADREGWDPRTDDGGDDDLPDVEDGKHVMIALKQAARRLATTRSLDTAVQQAEVAGIARLIAESAHGEAVAARAAADCAVTDCHTADQRLDKATEALAEASAELVAGDLDTAMSKFKKVWMRSTEGMAAAQAP